MVNAIKAQRVHHSSSSLKGPRPGLPKAKLEEEDTTRQDLKDCSSEYVSKLCREVVNIS